VHAISVTELSETSILDLILSQLPGHRSGTETKGRRRGGDLEWDSADARASKVPVLW